jgi:nicotinic acid phosphoribosyltransferase
MSGGNLSSTLHSNAIETSALLTDLHELTIAKAYAAEHMDQLAVFELAVRRTARKPQLPRRSRLGEVVDFLASLRFDHEELDGVCRSFFFLGRVSW